MKIYGSSDDLIEIDEDDLREEWNVLDKATHGMLIATSNGLLVRARYESDGNWRFTLLARGADIVNIIHVEDRPADPHGREIYSDLVDIVPVTPIQWVAIVRKIKRKARA